MEEAQLSAPLTNADVNLLLALRMPYLVLMATLFTANESFINFDDSAQWLALGLASVVP